jgi:hypothetical protein
MSFTVRLFAGLALLAAASPAQAAFINYTFTSDSSGGGGSLTGSFRVAEADLLDGILSTTDIQNYLFTFTDASGVATHYTLSDVLPDLPVDPATGIPLAPPAGFDGSVLGDEIGGDGLAQAFLTSEALTPGASLWVAISLPNGESESADSGLGHWEITAEGVDPVPAPAAVVLAVIGVGCVGIARRLRRGFGVGSNSLRGQCEAS